MQERLADIQLRMEKVTADFQGEDVALVTAALCRELDPEMAIDRISHSRCWRVLGE